MRKSIIFPKYPMPNEYVFCVFYEVLYSMALYIAQKSKGYRDVGLIEMKDAIKRLNNFISCEPEGSTMVGGFFFIVSSYEDLNAIDHYGLMKREDFLIGTIHRPWSNMVLSPSLALYEQLGLVGTLSIDETVMLTLTKHGKEILELLRRILSDAGELKWRSENQRWVIFSETDYDKVFSKVFPDLNQITREYLERLSIQNGTRILEVGAGTGRATVDLGLCDLVGPDGSVVALDPAAVLLEKLAAKCQECSIRNVEILQGVAEHLPFPDNSFDATIAVLALHFTDAPKAVAEMARVTKPGGFVSVLSPPSEFDLRDMPMVMSWFKPLISMAERFGMFFSEHNGLPVGLLKEIFEKSLDEADIWNVPGTCCAEDYKSFLAFMVKGAAFFQNIFSRLPFQERWYIMKQLETNGEKIAAETPREGQRFVRYYEAAWGRVPVEKA